MVQAGRHGTLPVAQRIISGMQRFIRRHAGDFEGALKDPGVWFIGTDFARDKDVLEELLHTKVRENRAQPPVKIGNDRKSKSRTKAFENLMDFGKEFPDPRLDELRIQLIEISVRVELPAGNVAVVEDVPDEFAPPTSVIVRTRGASSRPCRHRFPRSAESFEPGAFGNEATLPFGDDPVVIADAAREVKQGARGIEKDGFNHN